MNIRIVLWFLLAGLTCLAITTLVKAEDIEVRTLPRLYVSPERTLYDRHGRDVKACLAKMEAAMRAMHTFSIPTQRDQLTDQEVDQWLRAKQLWEATKKDCWTAP